MRELRFWICVLAFAALLAGGLAMAVRSAEREAIETMREGMRDKTARAREIPELAQTLRALKLVTVEIRTSVEVESGDESWRGDVLASVRAPVTLYYGVDLSGVEPSDLHRNPLTGEVTLRVPAPARIAVEVSGGDELTDVRVSGLRLRDVAGEYHLGMARVRLHERARDLTLGTEDRHRLEQTSREQVQRLVRAVTGGEAPVRVDFDRRASDVEAAGAEP